MPTAGWLRRQDLPVDGGGRNYIDPPSLDQILDQFANWRGDVNAGGHRLLNFNISPSSIEVGAGLTGNRSAWVDLIGDDTYTDYGMRMIRNPGPDGGSSIANRGLGALIMDNQDGAPFYVRGSSVVRLAVDSVATSITAPSPLGVNLYDGVRNASFYANTGNTDELRLSLRRDTAGTGWSLASWVLQRIVDGTAGMASIEWHGDKLQFRGGGMVKQLITTDQVRFPDPTNAMDDSGRYGQVQITTRNDNVSVGSALAFVRAGQVIVGLGYKHNDPASFGFGPGANAATFEPTLLSMNRYTGTVSLTAQLGITLPNAAGAESKTGILLERIYGDVGDSMDISWGATGRLSMAAVAGGMGGFIFYAQNAGGDGSQNEVMRIHGDGHFTIRALRSSSPGAGTKGFWYDPADGNRVKYAP